VKIMKWILWILGAAMTVSVAIHGYTINRVDFLSSHVDNNYVKRVELKESLDKIDQRMDRIDKNVVKLIDIHMKK
jgi:hypothetical protein